MISKSNNNLILSRSRPKVLIIESQLIVAADLSMQFLKLGCQVIGIYSSIAQAKKMIVEKSPDIIFLDLNSNGEFSRMKAYMIWKQFKIPFIFLSGETTQSIANQIVDRFVFALLSKPFSKLGLQVALDFICKQTKKSIRKPILTTRKSPLKII